MDVDLEALLKDEDWREALAEQAYYRERAEEAVVHSEHELEDCAYMVMSWESISDHAKKPYRTAVAEACDNLAEVVALA